MTEAIVPNPTESQRSLSCAKKLLNSEGKVIPLKTKIIDQGLWAMLRHVQHPFERFKDFARDHDESTSFLLLNIFSQRNLEWQNVGFIDWRIDNGVGKCENRQMFIEANDGIEKVAKEFFGHPFMMNSFYVIEEFQRNGIGTFLAALSLVALNELGCQEILKRRPQLTENSQLTWQKIGITPNEFGDPPINISDSTNVPEVASAITRFC